LTTPTCSALRAISTGGSASRPAGVKTRSDKVRHSYLDHRTGTFVSSDVGAGAAWS
jgi:hypothetical protein